jgi:hypothetical protein
MKYSYEITPRPVELGGGWRLRLLIDGEEIGGAVFPVRKTDPHEGITWWNVMTEDDRGQWLAEADSARPVDAYQTFLLTDAYIDAENEAYLWLATREK